MLVNPTTRTCIRLFGRMKENKRENNMENKLKLAELNFNVCNSDKCASSTARATDSAYVKASLHTRKKREQGKNANEWKMKVFKYLKGNLNFTLVSGKKRKKE